METPKCCPKCKETLFTIDTSRKFSQNPTCCIHCWKHLSKAGQKVQAGQRPDLSENKCLVYSTCSVSFHGLAKAKSKGLQGRRRKGIGGTERAHRGAWKANLTWLPFSSSAACLQCIPLEGKYTDSNSPPVSPACKCSRRVSKHTDFHWKQSY